MTRPIPARARPRSRTLALLGAALVPAALPALAQPAGAQEVETEAQTRLDPVIVQGSRLDQTQAEIGSSVSVITAEEIEALGFDFALDAIAAAPGVTAGANGAFGGTASVRIRGASSEQTLVLIDGVPVNDPTSPGGGFDFARLDTENIARIEILKGPQSVLWGTDAIGGVVSILTKRPEAGLGGSAFAEAGSFGTLRGGASLEGGNQGGDFRLAVTGLTSDGISKAEEDLGNTEDDAYEAVTLSASGGLAFGNGARLSADMLLTEAEAEFDSFDFAAPGFVADGDERSDTGELSANVSLTGALLDGRLENLLLAGYSEIERENFTDGAPSFDAEGDRAILRYQGTFAINPRNTLAFGAEREEQSAAGDQTHLNSLFALYEAKPADRLTLTGGLRVDDHQRFGTETTARAAAAFKSTEALTLRASWGQGFKAPTLFQTTFFCCGATAPNAGLEAETSEGVDFGLDYRAPGGGVEAGLTLFAQDVENQIDFSFAIGGYQNIAEVESRGVEAYGAVRLAPWLELAAAYAFIDAEDGSGNALVQIPEHSGDLTAFIDPEGPWSGAVLLRYNGEEESVDGTVLDGWTRVDLTGRYALNAGAEVFARVENLLDEDYQQILGYGTPDLSGSVGVRVRY